MADPRNRGKFVGRAGFEVAFAVLTGGAGEAANVGKVGEVANALEKGEAAVQSGRVLTGAVEETAEELAAREAAKTGAKQAGKELETVGGASKDSRVCQAEPVDVATGDMIVDAVDVELPGPVPFVWIRTWYSSSQRQGPLGHGWHHSYDLALWQEAAGTTYMRLSDGRLAAFEPLAADNNFVAYNRAEKLELRAVESGYAVHAIGEGFTYHFGPADHPIQYRLLHIADQHGHALRFSYCELGHLAGITDSVGRAIGVRTDAMGRILALDLPSPDGRPSAFAAVQYAYDEAGDLIAVTDAEGYATHFAYQAHLLSQRTFRTGISFYFKYDAQRRCVHTWGDNNYLNYRFAYEGDNTVIDIAEPVSQQTYTHQAGLVTRHVDGVGNVREWYYNPYGELELERDPLGQATLYDYDSQGNLLAVTYPDGTQVRTDYDHYQPVRFTDVMGNEWHWAYDEAGNQVLRIDATGLATHSAYEAGLLRAVASTGAQPTILDYDAHLNLQAVRLPDGQQRSWQHDALGRVTVLTDARGNTQRRTYDRLGQLRQVVEPDGNVRTLTYDGEGNVIRAQDAFHDVRLSYTGLNWLASRAQAGTQVRYDYNADGDLVRITNEAGRTHEFTLDAAGQVIAETRFDGQTRCYVRDAAGRVVTKLTGQSEQTTHYAYNPAGRITTATYPDGSQEHFTYRPDGTLAEARNAEQTVNWERDALGRVLHETQGAHRVSSRYNQAGQRLAVTSSLGAAVELERDDYGDVAQVRAAGWQAHFERDAQGFETSRTLSGGVQARWQRDALGRPVVQALTIGHQRRRRHYHWQGPDQLAELTDSTTGTTRFTYETGTLGRTTYPDGEQELRLPDAVGNLFATPAHQDRHYGPGGQLRQAGSTRYQYDELGNLTHKQTASGQHWYYQWNGVGQLTQVTRPDGTLVRFAYDALGRRIRKHYKGQITHWVWDGNQPLHEWTALELDGHNTTEVITWLFEEGSQAPLPKLAGAKRYSILTDHLGTPLELVDERGNSAWRTELSSYGQLRHLEGARAACPFRYQGQYEDTETGLYYNRFRYYDPQTGAYISQDPIGLEGGLAPYAYVADPNTWVDEFGLSGCPKLISTADKLKDAYRKGYDKDRILSKPWKKRINPSRYLKKRFTDAHLQQFHGEASYLVTGTTYETRIQGAPFIGRPDGLFLSTKTDISNVVGRANGDVGIIEKELGIPEGMWQNQKGLYRIDVQNPEKFNLRMPSGNEDGANTLWEPGGFVPGGSAEAVVDQIPAGSFKVTKIIP
jgi:RHS repeat-associated protein